MPEDTETSDFSLQSWGYAAGLLAAPVFLLFYGVFGETAGVFAGIVTAGCLIIAKINSVTADDTFHIISIASLLIIGLIFSAIISIKDIRVVICVGILYMLSGWCVIYIILKYLSNSQKRR